jgi:dynein intermediate chain 2
MIDLIEVILSKNNEIDMFENYFEEEGTNVHVSDEMSIKTLKLFKYGNEENKRQVSSISWHPDGPHKIAVSYAKLNFDSIRENYSYQSYIWDINNSNVPCNTISPKSPITKLAYNHKSVDQIAFGCYSGVVGLWDVRMQGN